MGSTSASTRWSTSRCSSRATPSTRATACCAAPSPADGRAEMTGGREDRGDSYPGVVSAPSAPLPPSVADDTAAPVRPPGRWGRLLDVPARLLRPVLLLNVVAQVGIVVTGGLVRLTGSGLGCPTWPQCVPGSYTPTVRQAQGWHKDVEFGNRLLTFVVGLAAAAGGRGRPGRGWRTGA